MVKSCKIISHVIVVIYIKIYISKAKIKQLSHADIWSNLVIMSAFLVTIAQVIVNAKREIICLTSKRLDEMIQCILR